MINVWFFIICFIGMAFAVVFSPLCFYIVWKKHFDRKNDELYRIMYAAVQKARALDNDVYNLKTQVDELSAAVNALGSLETKNANAISSLTSSIGRVMQEYARRDQEKIYPTPQLSEMISVTIDEFIRQEITMLRGMRMISSPNDPVTLKITRNVIRTYPHVDEEYLAKRVIQRLQEAVRE